MELEELINHEIKKITHSLLSQEHINEGIGLYTGVSGISLMLSQLYLTNSDQNINSIIFDQLQSIINQIETEENSGYLFSSGIAGWGWLILYIKRKNILDIEIDDLLTDLDIAIGLRMNHYLSLNNLDQLNGAIGIARYFLSREMNTYSETVIEYLYQNRIESDIEIKWSQNITGDPNKFVYDFSLSHGITGIIYFLSECYKRDIRKDLCERLLKGAISFLLNNIQNPDKTGSYFPNYINTKTYNPGNNKPQLSRLSWCYGDLSIWYTLFHTGALLDDDRLVEKSKNALIKTTKRISFTETSIKDAGFCHGSSGVAYIFNKLWVETNLYEFKTAADFWINQTINYNNNGESQGYKFFTQNSNNDLEQLPCNNFLTGQAGVATVYLSHLFPELSDWDEIMMLN